MEAQPLILGNTMFLPSMANVVRAVNKQSGVGVWQTNLCMPIQGSRAIDSHGINDKWGVLSTPVIDPDVTKMYLVAWCSDDQTGRPQTAQHYIYVLDTNTGKALKRTLVTGRDGSQDYDSAMRKQRSSLLLVNENGRKMVFFAAGSVMETVNGSAGWVIGYDCKTDTIAVTKAMTQGLGAGVWMAGQGIAADKEGFLYLITGNGSFNATNDWGEAVLKLQYTPGKLQVVSWWSPYSDSGRVGQNPTLSGPVVKQTEKLAGTSAVTDMMKDEPVGSSMKVPVQTKIVASGPTQETGQSIPLVYPLANSRQDAAWNDEDFGSAGGTLVEEYGVYLAAGKDGIAYPVRTQNMGDTQPADFANPKANCAKLAAAPVWFTASPGPVDPCPNDVTTLNFLPWGKTRHLHMTPVQYDSPSMGKVIFGWGENSQLHAWKMSSTGQLAYLGQSNESASPQVENSPGGMPGGFCSLSSNKGQQAVLWCSVPMGDGNATVTQGRLIAYDPENISRGSIPVLWDSQDWDINYLFNKFMPPIVNDGNVYLPDYNGGVMHFTLTPH